jgi:hypothetical protein
VRGYLNGFYHLVRVVGVIVLRPFAAGGRRLRLASSALGGKTFRMVVRKVIPQILCSHWLKPSSADGSLVWLKLSVVEVE